MSGLRIIQGVVVTLAVMGIVAPSPKLFANDQGKSSAPPVKKVEQATHVPDITLGAGGVFSGRVVAHDGTPLEGSEVVIKQGEKLVMKTVTDKNGLFTVEDMKSGIFQVSSGNTDGVFRLWSEKTAPPVAKGQALLVMGENGERGQWGGIDPWIVFLTAAIIASLILIAINLDRTNKINNKLKSSN